jgi:hypothetical protein
MKFFINATNATPQATAPVTARSTNRRTVTTRAVALLSAIVIMLCWYVGRPAINTARLVWPEIRESLPANETLAWLKVGAVFLLFSIATTAAILVARG